MLSTKPDSESIPLPCAGDAARVRTRLIDRVALAHDASHYLLTPSAVVTARDAGHVGELMRACAARGTPLTFRSGGTSLSGQAVTSGVLVDTRRDFRGVEVRDEGRQVWVQPGATVRSANIRLAPYGRKLGPDPASEGACTLGGVIANNSSGMVCGTEANTYRTPAGMVAVLPSGTVVDTGAADADEALAAQEPALHAGLLRLRDRVRASPESVRRIRAQFSMKNTMGYGLNSFLDFDRPADLLAHLVVGSEGTLAFVAEAVFNTVPVKPHAATGLVVFDSLAAATDALPALVDSGAATLELLDAASLRVAAGDQVASAALRSLTVDRHAALLVEYQEMAPEELAARTLRAAPLLAGLPGLAGEALLSNDARARADLWHIRKGLYAAVAGARPRGTTALLEDVVVPVPRLSHTCTELIRLFAEHGYAGAVIFGHAKDGNIHFMLDETFEQPGGRTRYARFTDEMVDLVLGEEGSLKAEHGTGRVMAGHVRRQYGDELFDVMREIKRLFDPHGVLNPGVVLSEDPEAYLQDMKSVPQTDPEVDRCVECGFREPVCPSRDLTLTPRQRIVVRRGMAVARATGDHETLAALDADYRYDGVETCAADGMCRTACPVLIDTGSLVRRLRAEDRGPVVQRAGSLAAGHWSGVTRAAAIGLDAAGALPAAATTATRLGRRVLGSETVPEYRPGLPRGGHRRPAAADPAAPAAVFLPTCTGAMFGPEAGGEGSTAAFLSLCARAGVELAVPPDADRLCCGTPWSSKGLTKGKERMHELVRGSVSSLERGRGIPVVCDASSCTEGFRTTLGAGGVEVVDAVTFVRREVLPRLQVHRRWPSLALHPTCSSVQLGIDADLRAIADVVADVVVVPVAWGCCGFAGDRGLLHPELTASATAAEAAEVRAAAPAVLASCNRTCEIGMTRAVGRPYHHVLELLDAATTPGEPLPCAMWPAPEQPNRC
ncbi:FAD-binding and (Fe-S)-binding domain-containing protein [Pseudonocardia bannensis]|uniref:FAD-binding and (Fe-S)-binding domain-containing protein n=1 Tax=Pseudonocardia bannensis TaxID=630973 RepID=UPI0028A956FE|nr:FAD-binding and (Fe-S)-binding domain-containing protein [Pseudonocardia bannensis]